MNTQKRIKNAAVAIMLIGFLGLMSCEQKNDIDTPQISVELDDELYIAEVSDDIVEITDEAVELVDSYESTLKDAEIDGPHGEGGRGQGKVWVRGHRNGEKLGECAMVTRDTTEGNCVTTIDFGEENCTGNDNRNRRGQIIMTHEGTYWDSLVVINITFVDFYVDDNQVVGEKTRVQTINEDGTIQSSITASVTVILADSSGTISYESEKTRTIVEGYATRTRKDDVTETTGNSSCTLADGSVSEMNILAPLVRLSITDCGRYIVSGIREVVTANEPTKTIDYGNGTCDSTAQVTVDGVTTEIELGRNKHRVN